MKVPGSEQLEKCWGMSHQRQSCVQNNRTHHGCKKKTKAGRNKRISQKLRCPSCGDMSWTRWIGPKPRNERAQDARCPKATWNRVGGTTETTKTFLKLTLKLWPVNSNFKIKGPEKPTRQLLPIMSTKCCSGDGERRKDKGCGGGPTSKTKLCACDKVVCERWCVTKKDAVCVKKLCVWKMVCASCVWKRACDKVVCERWCVTKLVCERWCGERWCVTKLCAKDGVVKDGVWQSYVWKMVSWKMVCDKVVCEGWCRGRWCVTKWCVKDGGVKDGVGASSVWKRVCDKVVCERWCVKDGG